MIVVLISGGALDISSIKDLPQVAGILWMGPLHLKKICGEVSHEKTQHSLRHSKFTFVGILIMDLHGIYIYNLNMYIFI